MEELLLAGLLNRINVVPDVEVVGTFVHADVETLTVVPRSGVRIGSFELVMAKAEAAQKRSAPASGSNLSLIAILLYQPVGVEVPA